MNIKTETSFVNRSKDILLLPLLFTYLSIASQAMDAKMERTKIVEWDEKHEEKQNEKEIENSQIRRLHFVGALTWPRSSDEFTLAGVDERKVFHHQERAWLPPGSMYRWISVLVCDVVCGCDPIRIYVIHMQRRQGKTFRFLLACRKWSTWTPTRLQYKIWWADRTSDTLRKNLAETKWKFLEIRYILYTTSRDHEYLRKEKQ